MCNTASLCLLKKKTSQRGLAVYYLWGSASNFAGGHFQHLWLVLEGHFQIRECYIGDHFFMKVVHSSNERELKLNVTAVNCKHRSYNCYNCYKHDCRWSMWWVSAWLLTRIFVVSTEIGWVVNFPISLKFIGEGIIS